MEKVFDLMDGRTVGGLPVINGGLAVRPRRLRRSGALRRLVSENDVLPRHLVLPLFVKEGLESPREIGSLPGVRQHTETSVIDAVQEAIDVGIGGVMLFGVPLQGAKDPAGSSGKASDGILNRIVRVLSERFGERIVIITDLCLDEFTDHGHCGVLDGEGNVDNDATVAAYAEMAVSQAEAGTHVVSPSGMMDGQVAAIRKALDEKGHYNVAIMAYAVKYASAFYGPFRQAVDSSLQGGDRNQYQMDPANGREAVRESMLDLGEGADLIIVKPAMSYLDVLYRVKEISKVPVAAYQVSAEYSMIAAAASNGWVDRDRTFYESFVSMRRAGADIIISYEAVRAARILRDMV